MGVASVRNRSIFTQIHRLFGPGSITGLGDAHLLDRFVRLRDEEAFAAIVARHGPMVLGVCRRTLTDPNDAEDAFQATFLVLVRRATAIRNQELLGNWLYGVARRVASRARAVSVRRKAVEALAAATLAELSAKDARRAELREILDQEIARLSARDRAVIVLCDLEGRSSDEVARLLGVHAVTLRSRLHRARGRLKGRLARRGVTPGAGLAVATAAVTVPASLAEAALVSAMRYASDPVTIGAVSAPVAALTEGFLGTTMMMTKLKVVGAVLALGLLATSVGALAQSPYPPGGMPPGSADRLREVEQKLDRVLSALEGISQGPFATHPGAMRKAAEPAATKNETQPKMAPPTIDAGAPNYGGGGVQYQPDGAPGYLAPAGKDPFQTPSATIEKRLSELERRLSRLEQHVFAGGMSAAPKTEFSRPFDAATKSADAARPK